MAKRFYLVPKVALTPVLLGSGPRYIASLGVTYAAMDYGFDPTYLVGAEVTAGQHTALAAEPDVTTIPLNLDNTITAAALPQVEAALEALQIPAGWVTTAHTYREVLSIVGRLFRFMGVFRKRQLRSFFESGVTLNLRINELTQAQRDALEDAAVTQELSSASITGTTLVRQALKIWIDQMPGFTLFGEAF